MKDNSIAAQTTAVEDPAADASGAQIVSLDRTRRYRVAAGDPDVRGWQVLGSDGQPIGRVDDLLVDTAALKVRYLQVRLAPAPATGTAPDPARPVDLAEQAIPALDSLAALGGIAGVAAVPGVGMPLSPLPGGAVSIEEYLVRETLSDTENALTADHHLGDHHSPGERHVLIPIGLARLDTGESKVHVEALTAGDVRRLPPYEPGRFDRAEEERLRQAFDGSWNAGSTGDFYDHDFYDEGRFYRSRRGDAETPPRR